MNDNYIAPEAFDESNCPKCRHCGYVSNTTEQKISYYRGICVSCNDNPSVINKSPKKKSIFFTSSFEAIVGNNPCGEISLTGNLQTNNNHYYDE